MCKVIQNFSSKFSQLNFYFLTKKNKICKIEVKKLKLHVKGQKLIAMTNYISTSKLHRNSIASDVHCIKSTRSLGNVYSGHPDTI